MTRRIHSKHKVGGVVNNGICCVLIMSQFVNVTLTFYLVWIFLHSTHFLSREVPVNHFLY